jgi:hypothetical protein
MEDENRDNNLDKFFQSRLNEGEGASNWNSPPDSVLEGAIAELDKRDNERKRRRLFWILWLGSLVALTSVLSWYMLKVSTLEEELADMRNSKEQTVDLIEQDNEKLSKNESESESVYEENSSNEIKSLGKENTEENRKLESNIRVVRETSSYNKTSNEAVVENEKVEELISLIKDDKYEEEVTEKDIITESITIVDPEPEEVVPEIKDVEDTTGENENNPDPRPKMNKRFVLALYAGLNGSSFSMSAAQPLPDNLTRYDNRYLGYQFGLRLDRKLKNERFFLRVGAEHMMVKNSSQFDIEETYDEDMETTNNSGVNIYSAEYGFDSPMGRFSEPVEFEIDGKNLNDGDKLNSSMKMNSKFRIWNLYVGGGYNLFTGEKITVNINSGLQMNYISEMRQEMDYRLSKNQLMLSDENYLLTDLPTMNHSFLSWKLGAGLNYRKGRMIFGIDGVYQRSLQSIREVEKVSKVKTQMSQFQSNISVGWMF